MGIVSGLFAASFFFFRQKKKTRPPIRAIPTTAAITAPAITPALGPESPLFEVVAGAEEVAAPSAAPELVSPAFDEAAAADAEALDADSAEA